MDSTTIVRIVSGVLFAIVLVVLGSAPPHTGELTRIVPWIQRRRANEGGCRCPVLQLRRPGKLGAGSAGCRFPGFATIRKHM